MLRILSFVLVLLPLLSIAQTDADNKPEPTKKHVCFLKKRANKDHVSELNMLYTRELIINKKADPLNQLNGKSDYSLKELLFEYWDKELKTDADNSIQNIEIDKKNVNYLVDVVKVKDKTVIVSITLLVKNTFGKEYATLIFCMQDIKKLLDSATVVYKNKKMSVWNYLHRSDLPSKAVSSSKLKAEGYPCYFD